VTEHQLGRIRSWWHSYVRRFDEGDAELRRNARLKKVHTRRVCREASLIAGELGCPAHDLRMIEAIALLHDVGRFAQYAKYRTFADPKSENHALLGLKILKKEKVLRPLSPPEQSLVRRAIRYHNQPTIPPVRDSRLIFFARILRDADKLDIWRVAIGNHYALPERKNQAISIGLPNLPGVSPGVMEDLRAGRIVESRHVKRLNDLTLLQMGWVFDLYFPTTMRAVKRRGYLEKLRGALPDDEEMQRAYEIARSHMESRMTDGVLRLPHKSHLARERKGRGAVTRTDIHSAKIHATRQS